MDLGLLVLGPVERQPLRVAELLEGLAETGDVAVAEDPPDPGDEPLALAVALDLLAGEEADDGLPHGQADGLDRGRLALAHGASLARLRTPARLSPLRDPDRGPGGPR